MYLININIFKNDDDKYIFLSDVIGEDDFSYDQSVINITGSPASSAWTINYRIIKVVSESDLVFKIKDKIFLFSPSLLNARSYYTSEECYHQVFLLKNLIGYVFHQPEIFHVTIIKNRYADKHVEILPSNFEIIDTRRDPLFISQQNFQLSLPPQFFESGYYRGYKTCDRCFLLTHGDTSLKVYTVDDTKRHLCVFCTDSMKDSLTPKSKELIENDLKQVRLIRPQLEEEWLLNRMKKEL